MGFTQVNTDLMFSALDHFLEADSPVRIFRDDLGISFETALGNYGLVIPNEEGNWDILVNDLKIYDKTIFSYRKGGEFSVGFILHLLFFT